MLQESQSNDFAKGILHFSGKVLILLRASLFFLESLDFAKDIQDFLDKMRDAFHRIIAFPEK